jgi:hypothetical protein
MKASLLTCNPGTVKDTRDTCLPKAMISRLVKEWNTRHPEKHVAASENKMEQWNNLRREMVTCDTEFCAVKKLVDPKEKKEFQKFFRPEAPSEWKKDPDAWLSTDDIEDVMEQYEDAFPSFEFIGPVPIDFDAKSPVPSWGDCIVDEMCKLDLRKMKSKGTEKIGICFNFDPHDKPGSHWVAAMIDLKEDVAYYYDSYGKGPPKEINRFFERCKQQGTTKILFNDIRHQRKMSECGMYSIYFMVAMLFGKSFSEICLDELTDRRMLLLRKIFFSNESVTKEELNEAFQWFR